MEMAGLSSSQEGVKGLLDQHRALQDLKEGAGGVLVLFPEWWGGLGAL